jgi:DNA repair exonuclease SbcCD nuclease subunit
LGKVGAIMIRFIHTADWQIGLRVRYIPGDAGALVRNARLQTLDRIGQLARERDVDFVVVAGDVFEHHGLRPATLRQTFDALASWPCPVYLLPGNHDPLTADSLYLGEAWQKAPPNVFVLADTEPVPVALRPERIAQLEAGGQAVPAVVLLPCPLRERHTLDDTTEHLAPHFGPPRLADDAHPGGAFRVGVAHGGIFELLGSAIDAETELNNPIARDAATRGGLDYLALGDWHSTLKVDARTWYSGAPEATRFKEIKPGQVLVVSLTAPGAEPEVEPVDVATQQWRQQAFEVNHADDVPAVTRWLDSQPDKRNTLLELFLSGAPDADTLGKLEATLEDAEQRYLWVRRRDAELQPMLSADDLDAIATTGWTRAVVDELRISAERGEADAADALRLLYRLQVVAAQETGGAR